MAQTTGAISFKDVKIELSTDGVSWTDASGHANNIKLGGGDINTGEYFTASGNTAILKAGKQKPLKVTIEVAYTETASEPWDMANTAYSNVSPLYARWSPKGGNSTNKRYTTASGYCTSPPYPVGDVEKGDIVKTSIVIETPSITVSAVP